MENNNRQGCRWTKCSEQMPDLSQYAEPELHFRFDGKKVCGVQFMSDGFEVKILSIYHGFYNKDLHRLEYLDESIEPCATSSENYWKKRCEAAEKIVAIAGIVDCAGYDQWQKLKTMSDNYPSGISEIYPEVTGFLNSLPISKYQRKILYRALNQKPETKLAKEWRQLYEGMFDEWEEHHKALEEIRTIALNGYISSGWQKVIEITNKELNKPSNI